MLSQKAAEREEQQRIKNLVLNYDLRDGEEQDGELTPYSSIPRNFLPKSHNVYTSPAGIERERAAAMNYANRLDKSGNNRSVQRARKLQLSDVDSVWYAKPTFSHIERLSSAPPVSAFQSGYDSSPSARFKAGNSAKPGSRRARKSKGGRVTRKDMLREHSKRIATLREKENLPFDNDS